MADEMKVLIDHSVCCWRRSIEASVTYFSTTSRNMCHK
jgi:hypothetical protein